MTPVEALEARQRPDGSWLDPPDGGALTTALGLLALDRIGVLEAAEADAMAQALLSRVRADGMVPSYPGAPHGSRPTTALVDAALSAAGIHGAVAHIADPDPLTAAICNMGQRRLPTSTAPLSIPAVRALLSRLFGFNAVMGAHLFLPIFHPPRTARGRRTVIRYLLDRQDANGSWASIGAFTALGLVALHQAGLSTDQPGPAAAVAYLRDAGVPRHGGLDLVPFSSAVWDTARAVRVLARAGRDVDAGVAWLLRARCVREAPEDWQTPRPGAPKSGGWSFGPGGQLTPDCDTTALVLDALVAAGEEGTPIEEAAAWLWGMQNRDGGWAAFTWGQPTKPTGPLGTRPPHWPESVGGLPRWWRELRATLGDPSTAEVTGRVLSNLATLGHDWKAPRIAGAVNFIRQQQWRGAWWGRWSVGYAPPTADVLAGLAAVGVDRRLPWIRIAADRLVSWQHADGGWGETPEVLSNPDLAGQGPSNAYHTGEAVDALCRLDGPGPAVDRGARWLASNLTGGTWPDDAVIGIIQPPWGCYTLGATLQCAGIEGLRVHASTTHRPPRDASLAWPLPPGSRRWSFRHVLKFEAPIGDVYDALSDVGSWTSWWHGLEVEDLVPGDADGVGRVRRVRFQTPLGYAIGARYALVIAERPTRLVGFVAGDLEGVGRFELSEAAGITRVVYHWEVCTTRGWMNRVARFSRPVLLWNHDQVMKWFGRGLARQLGASLREMRFARFDDP